MQAKCLAFLFISLTFCHPSFAGTESAVKVLGERLFRETRFSQYFAVQAEGLLNQLPKKGDTSVEDLLTLNGAVQGPYRGQAMSCAACHMVDQANDIAGAGARVYSDFARRSPVPDRGDGLTTTLRNSPTMAGTAIHSGMSLHMDGEFSTPEQLVASSYTGRNMGWLVGEEDAAIHQIAEIIRWDDGNFPTSGGLKNLRYQDLFSGVTPVSSYGVLPDEFRFDATHASDADIFNAVVKLVGAYLKTLDYSKDVAGHYDGSPYDLFLRKNHLPLAPAPGEDDLTYSKKLMATLLKAKSVQWVDGDDGHLKLHRQDFAFGEPELHGMRIFFGKGACIQCHAAPDFTDHAFHNTGVSQDEYDRLHGFGQFMKLAVPNLIERNTHPELYLPPSKSAPQSVFLLRSIPDRKDPRRADLGAWAVFANPAMPQAQTLLRTQICKSLDLDCSNLTEDDILNKSLGLFKTPSCRDLGHSEPYLHNGHANKIEDILIFYIKYGMQARMGKVRNGDPHLKDVELSVGDVADVTLFLKALNEDFK